MLLTQINHHIKGKRQEVNSERGVTERREPQRLKSHPRPLALPAVISTPELDALVSMLNPSISSLETVSVHKLFN